ncbi:unnamed protein product [Sphagnum jensenii]|uniref:Xaa-Pro dipeptidyl-peptidase C-terminal domain-containing protein n=1 Tax=Sphagnum jensenii TaxID=128206 RepID=A0ABP0VKA7_9BRYO
MDPIFGSNDGHEIEYFTAHGYACVIVDVRGTGASLGDRKMEFSPEEVADGNEIVNWIAAQKWSDGNIGTTGVSYLGTTAEMLLRAQHMAQIATSGTAIYRIGGWYDGALTRGLLDASLNTPNTVKVLVGPWDHGPADNVSPFALSKKVNFNIHAEMLRFFDYYLKGIDNGIENEPKYTYFTVRDRSLQARHSNYADRREEDKKLLSFTSEAINEPMQITGHPVLRLNLSADADDATVFCYLEDVGPDSSVTYITEGMIRPIDRKVTAMYNTICHTLSIHTRKRIR